MQLLRVVDPIHVRRVDALRQWNDEIVSNESHFHNARRMIRAELPNGEVVAFVSMDNREVRQQVFHRGEVFRLAGNEVKPMDPESTQL